MLFDLIHTLLKLGYSVFLELAGLLLEYLRVLIWPLAVLTLALIYRRPLVSVLDRLKKASGWGVEVETEARDLALDTTISAAESDSDAHSLDAPPPRPVTQEQNTREEGLGTGTDNTPDFDIEALRRRIDRLERESPVQTDLRPTVSRSALSLLRRNSPSWTWSESERMGRVNAAWYMLSGLASLVGRDLGLVKERRTVQAVFRGLHKRNLVATGPWRQAARISALYTAIQEDSAPPSEETVSDFVTAARNLMTILQDVQPKVLDYVDRRTRPLASNPDVENEQRLNSDVGAPPSDQ